MYHFISSSLTINNFNAAFDSIILLCVFLQSLCIALKSVLNLFLMNLIMLCFILISFLVVFANCLFSFHFYCSKLRLLVYLENYLWPDKSQGKARVLGWNQSVKSSSAPATDSKKSTWPWPANEATREYAGWEAAALFPWIQNLKGVTRTFAATLLLKRKSFSEDRTHREEDGSPFKAWMARNHFVRILSGPHFGAECKASVLLDISLIGVS